MAGAPRFLVGVDFSPCSRLALTVARELAAQSGATLTIAHVRPFSDVRAAVVLERGDLLRHSGRSLASEIRNLYERKLAALARDGERTVLLRGAPDVALSREARKGYDLVLLGRRGQGQLSSLVLGSTTLRTLTRAPVPVLVVPERRR
jgi:nucleotide-binding universal stress UspA family protein